MFTAKEVEDIVRKAIFAAIQSERRKEAKKVEFDSWL